MVTDFPNQISESAHATAYITLPNRVDEVSRRYPPLANMVKPSKWGRDHVSIITGPGAFEYARSLYRSNQCQPAIPCPENVSPELYQWPVKGMDITVKNLGSSDADTEKLVYELLKAGAILVVNADDSTGAITVYRQEALADVA